MTPPPIRRAGVVAAVLALALAGGAAVAAAGSLLPAVPEARGGECVAEPEVMRRTHMDLLKHQRDRTMRQGVRGEPYSLAECIDCHAVKDASGAWVTAESTEHFCVACHEYAAVEPDCFACHASTPAEADPAREARR